MKQILLLLISLSLLTAADIALPKPNKTGGLPLYEALMKRQTGRNFDTKELSQQQISQILWAAFGVNREEGGKRTAPSAWGNKEITLYVMLKSGTYTYDADKHSLKQIDSKDLRAFGGIQEFVKDAPMTIILVADKSKITQTEDATRKSKTASVDAGFIGQNIYLAAASEGLITGARVYLDIAKLTELLKLNSEQEIVLAHSVGYAK